MHATTRARLKQTGKALASSICQSLWKIREHNNAKWLGQLPRLLVVVSDGREFIAQIFLNDGLHILGEIRQFLLNMARLAPNSLAHQ